MAVVRERLEKGRRDGTRCGATTEHQERGGGAHAEHLLRRATDRPHAAVAAAAHLEVVSAAVERRGAHGTQHGTRRARLDERRGRADRWRRVALAAAGGSRRATAPAAVAASAAAAAAAAAAASAAQVAEGWRRGECACG